MDDAASYSGVPLALPVAPMIHNISVLCYPGSELDSALYYCRSLHEAQVERESAQDFFIADTGRLA